MISVFSTGVAKGIEKPTSDKDGFPSLCIRDQLFIKNNSSTYSNNWNKVSNDSW